jgi:hypothetical protein
VGVFQLRDIGCSCSYSISQEHYTTFTMISVKHTSMSIRQSNIYKILLGTDSENVENIYIMVI